MGGLSATVSGTAQGDKQRWRFNKDGSIVSEKCGPREGNLALAPITSKSLKEVTAKESVSNRDLHVAVSFVNPSSRKALSFVENAFTATNYGPAREVQLFYLKQTTKNKFKVVQLNRNPINLSSNNWEYKEGKLLNNGKALILKDQGNLVFEETKEEGQDWDQLWTLKSDQVILKEASGGDDKSFQPVFTPEEGRYNFDLLPGFPGTIDGNSCLTSTQDKFVAWSAMHSCDKSMAFVAGKDMSVGE